MQRNTRQRQAILEVFERTANPLSALETHRRVRARVPGAGLATIYRALGALAAEGRLSPVALPGQPARYEKSAKEHHHYFQCDECHRVFEIDACPGDMARQAPKGFAVKRHEVILYGECGECGEKRRPAARAGGRRTHARSRPKK